MSLKKGTVRAKEIENINAQDVSDIKTTLALENVDNTSDANKPISTDTQNALNLKADDSSISSVGKTGNHSDLNLDDGTNPHNTNQSDVGLGNVDNTSDLNKPVSNATQNALDDKVDKVAGKGLSDENYTLSEKNKLSGIESGAEANTVDSVNTQTGDVVLDADNIDDVTTTKKFTSQSDIDRLANTSGTNTGDQDISGIGVNASDITDLQNNKVDKVAGQGLSDENYTLSEKNKLAGIEDGAEVNIPETITNLSITGNTLTYVNENGTNQDIDLSLYLDDTNLARIISGEYVAGDNVLRFTRDDGSTFDIDASMFFDDTNIITSVNTQTGEVVLDADDINDATTTNKFTSQADINRLANTSGTNTGDQDISGIQANASNITDLQNNKVDKVAGKGLSTEDYTTNEKNKLAGIESGAEVNIPETITNLSITGNTLTYVNENGTSQDIDLSLYLDDTNLARIISGEYVAGDNVLRFTRDDGSTFDIDASMFFDDTNLVTSVNTQTGDVVLDADDINDSTTTNKFTSQSDIDRLANTSGTNTGDQDLSNYVDQADAKNLSLGENYANVKINDFVSDGFDVYPTDAGYQYAKLLQENKLNDTKVFLLPQATKAGELGANKGSNFTASRATTATRVNENGLIESVAVNVPRIDYANGNCPSILVEGQATNLLTYSEEFDNADWNKIQSTVSVDNSVQVISGANHYRLESNNTNDGHRIQKNILVNSDEQHSLSIFAKAGTLNYIGVLATGGANQGSIFNLSNGNKESDILAAPNDFDIKPLDNGWYLISITVTTTSTTQLSFNIYAINNGNSIFYPGGGLSEYIYVTGAQLEEGTEASSYIPTTSSAVTRNADVLSNNLTNVLQPTYTAFIEITANDSRLKVEDVDTGFDIPLNGTGKIVMVVDSQITFYFPDNGQPQTTLVYEKPDDFRDLEILSKLNSNSIKLLAIENGVATQTEINNFVSGDITSYFIETDWGNETDYTNEFRENDWDYFPVIDTSNGVVFPTAWRENNLKSFPLIDTSTGTDFRSAWRSNPLKEFPSLNLNNGNHFAGSWRDNQLTSFPSNMFDNLTNPSTSCFVSAWLGNSIDAQGVENILVSIDTSGANAPSNGDIEIGSDGSALTTAAQNAKTSLESKGWIVDIN